MSAGMNVETAWPMWRGPDAYGHATATRIFVMGGVRKGATPDKGFARPSRWNGWFALPRRFLAAPHHLRSLALPAAARDRDEPARPEARDPDDDESDPERRGPLGDDFRRPRGCEELEREAVVREVPLPRDALDLDGDRVGPRREVPRLDAGRVPVPRLQVRDRGAREDGRDALSRVVQPDPEALGNVLVPDVPDGGLHGSLEDPGVRDRGQGDVKRLDVR